MSNNDNSVDIDHNYDDNYSENLVNAWKAGTPAISGTCSLTSGYQMGTAPLATADSGSLWYAHAYAQWLQNEKDIDQNCFNWTQDLLKPSIIGIAQWALEEKRINDRDEIFEDMRELSDEALARFKACKDEVMDEWLENAPKAVIPAEYVPIDCCEVYTKNILCNLGLMDKAQELISEITSFHTQQSLQRINLIDSSWQAKSDLISSQIGDLLNGKLPISDLMETSTESCERLSIVGGIGGGCNSRRMDLGISELRANREGFDREMANRSSLNRDIMPLSMMGDIRSTLKDPKMAVDLAQRQAELKQNSDQNKNNLEAIVDPSIEIRMMQELQACTLCFQGAMNKALLQNLEVNNMGRYAQPVINGIADGITSAFGSAISSRGNAPLSGNDGKMYGDPNGGFSRTQLSSFGMPYVNPSNGNFI